VVLDGASAEEQPGGYVPVGGPARRQLGDLKFLRGEPEAARIGALLRLLARGGQLSAGRVGEAVHAHPREAFQRGAELITGIAPAPLPTQPFPVDQARAGQREIDRRALEVVDGLLIAIADGGVIARQQRAATREHANGPGGACRCRQRGEGIKGRPGDLGPTAALGGFDHVFRGQQRPQRASIERGVERRLVAAGS
jgi:hypothetical protein